MTQTHDCDVSGCVHLAEVERLRKAMQHVQQALEAEAYGEAWTCLRVTLKERQDD